MKHIREQRGLELIDVAFAMGCTHNELQQMEDEAVLEHGGNYLAKLTKWCECHGVDMALLLEGEWTTSSEESLYLGTLRAHEQRAWTILAALTPQPAIGDCLKVLERLKQKFDLFWESFSTKPIGYRRTEEFVVDDYSVGALLKAVQRGQ